VREWTAAPRLNYTSRQTVGDRYCLLGHAVGFVDPLFSRGLVNTFESIVRVAPVLLQSVKTNVWKRENLLSLERYSLEVVRINDRLVANSYTAFRSFPLWNAWFRIWLAGSYIGVLRLRRILADYLAHRDDEALRQAFERATYPGHLSIESHCFESMFDAACSAMERLKADEVGEREVIDLLHGLYEENRAHLPLDFADFTNRYISRPTAEFAQSLLDWANHAPDGLAAKLARGASARPFDFLDSYRYGDRLALAERADERLLAARQVPKR
jgi:FADH2 O2-dependent halogenase